MRLQRGANKTEDDTQLDASSTEAEAPGGPATAPGGFGAPPLIKEEAPSTKSSTSKGVLFSLIVCGVAAAVFFIAPAILPKAGPPADELLGKMAAGLEKQGNRSATFNGTLSFAATGGLQDDFGQTASFDGAFDGNEFKVKAEAEGDDASGPLEIMLLSEGIYFKDPETGRWQVFPFSVFNALTGPDSSQQGSGSGNPLQQGEASFAEALNGLADLDGPSFEGPVIDGVETWEIRPLLSDFTPSSGSDSGAASSSEEANPFGNASLSIYVGREDGLPRRVEADGTITAGSLPGLTENPFQNYANEATVSMTVDLSAWGKPVQFKRPAHAVNALQALQDALQSGDFSQIIPPEFLPAEKTDDK